MAPELHEDGDGTRAGGDLGDKTIAKPTIHQPQPAQNIAGTSGDWPKYQTVRCKEYAIANPRNKDHATTFFGPSWKEFSKQNMALRRKIRSQLRSMRSITDQTRLIKECGRLVDEKKKAQHLTLEKVGEELNIIIKKHQKMGTNHYWMN